MELQTLLPIIVNVLMAISIGGILLTMLFTGKVRLNGKERGGRNLVLTLGASLVATLIFSIVASVLSYDTTGGGLSYGLLSDEAQVFAGLAILSFLPILVVLPKIIILALRRRQNHA
jgi:hypothetical protein